MDDGFKNITPDDAVEEKDLEKVLTAPALHSGEDPAAVKSTSSETMPLSKARSVALVATIAAAPFLNVDEPLHELYNQC